MPFTATGPSNQSTVNNWSSAAGTVTSAASRPLVAADNGAIIEVDASVTYTYSAGLPDGFACVFLLLTGVTATIASDGNTTMNGAKTTLTRAQSATQYLFTLQTYRSLKDTAVVTGS